MLHSKRVADISQTPIGTNLADLASRHSYGFEMTRVNVHSYSTGSMDEPLI